MSDPTCTSNPAELLEQLAAGEISTDELLAELGLERPRLTEQQLRERLAVADFRIAQLELSLDARAAQAQRQIDRLRESVRRGQREYDELATKYHVDRQRLERLSRIHTPSVGEHHVVTSIVRHVQRLEHPSLEVHVFADGRRLL